MSDDPRGFGVKLQTQMEKKVGSVEQPSTRTVEGSGDALRKQGNDTCVMGAREADAGDKPYNTGSNQIDAGKGTTNKGSGGGMTEMPQKFTPGSGVPPSRLGD